MLSVGSVQMSYLKNKRRYGSVLSSQEETATKGSSSCDDSKRDLKTLCVL
jgi:hypothetical protein